ncbi:hypothetical protein FG386_001380 [Cryptosporidium ryanae]|uniref:uncharacterized protein n=1 Tax=Cryptosporidium ryanae TaxID=515981 RepID=UPI00351A07D1|nr:hypothetical protein FG386_001380 [Cryptosporidium ryanae]
MSKLNDFFEKKKQKAKGLNELLGSKRPTIGSFKLNSVEPGISSVISDGNVDEWSVSTETKETTDLFIGGKNLSAEGFRRPSNPQMIVGIKTSKPDFDSNIWKSKSGDSNAGAANSSSGKVSTDDSAKTNIDEDEDKDKPKETLKYNIRARLAARGEKVDFLSAKDPISSMPTLAAAFGNVSRPKSIFSPGNLYNNSNLKGNERENMNIKYKSGRDIEEENNNDMSNEVAHQNKKETDIENTEGKDSKLNVEGNIRGAELNDQDLIGKLRSCNIDYLNSDILFNCIIDIEQSKLKYSEIAKDF